MERMISGKSHHVLNFLQLEHDGFSTVLQRNKIFDFKNMCCQINLC